MIVTYTVTKASPEDVVRELYHLQMAALKERLDRQRLSPRHLRLRYTRKGIDYYHRSAHIFSKVQEEIYRTTRGTYKGLLRVEVLP